jgi:hypothetical protein
MKTIMIVLSLFCTFTAAHAEEKLTPAQIAALTTQVDQDSLVKAAKNSAFTHNGGLCDKPVLDTITHGTYTAHLACPGWREVVMTIWVTGTFGFSSEDSQKLMAPDGSVVGVQVLSDPGSFVNSARFCQQPGS